VARTAISVGGVTIRLTEERWFHIAEHHDEVAGYAATVLNAIEDPDFVAEGWEGEFLAVKRVKRKHLVVVYREVSRTDGFVITAFFTRSVLTLNQRNRVWPPSPRRRRAS